MSASRKEIIQVSDVEVSFGDLKALDRVALNVPEGEIRGLLGPNGAGKTTLVKAIATLLTPDKGSIRVSGFDVVKHAQEVRSVIGLAGQYAAVEEMLTGRENLEIFGSLYQLSRNEAKSRSNEILERLSLLDAGDRLVKTYSGGMRRRLDLGACLVGRPKVLILDEPTTGLDPRTRIEMWSFIQELVSDGATVLLTTQYLEEADQLADQITMIDKGKVVIEGSPNDLKDVIGGEMLVVEPRNVAQLDQLRDCLDNLNLNSPVTDTINSVIKLKVEENVEAVVQAANLIREHQILVANISLESPSLDEVFLSLTD